MSSTMTRRLGTGFCALVLVLSLASCVSVSMPTAREASISFATRAVPVPTDLVWSVRSQAHELINMKDLVVVVSGGTDPMSDAQWLKYKPILPWVKNIERNLLFDGSFFIRSPYASEDATGMDRYTIRTVAGHTWVELAQPVAIDFIPAGQEVDMVKSAPGHLVVKTIRKPQVLRWSSSIYRLTDNRGNFYVMHATEAPQPSLAVDLPEGWSLERVALDSPLVITPSAGGFYNVEGDCLGQGYHQYIFAGDYYPAR